MRSTVVQLSILSLIILGFSSAFVINPTTSITASSSSSSPISSSNDSSLQRRCFSNKQILYSSTGDDNSSIPSPDTFREAEILGLRLMQEGEHEQALKVFKNGMKLPGSRKDIIRTQTLSGPSPVGGSAGGREGRVVQTLDEFELQAAHYNIACASARLGNIAEACQNLEKAFENGFDNYDTVRADPDLSDVHGTLEFDTLMEKWNPKKGFFGLFK